MVGDSLRPAMTTELHREWHRD